MATPVRATPRLTDESSGVTRPGPALHWDALHELALRYGDGFYIVDMDAFRRNYVEFLEAFRTRYPSSNLGYSYKTNYTPALCRAVDELGGYAEVVSFMEYELAVRIGVDPKRIIFNGPYKPAAQLAVALRNGSNVNLDSAYEVKLVETIARQSPDVLMRVGLRCNVAPDAARPSRFGFDVDSPDLLDAVATLRMVPNVHVGGLHCHVSQGSRSAASFAARSARVVELSEKVFANEPPRFINMGGGYFSKMAPELKSQFSVPIPSFDEYAEAITDPVIRAYGKGALLPELVLEPGTALTADVMHFAAKVINVKSVRQRTVALCAGSIHNIKPTMHDKNMACEVVAPTPAPLRNGDETQPESDIVGYTCMEHDVLHSGYRGDVAAGDYVLFRDIGAYTVVMKPPFILPAPPMLAYEATSGSFTLARRAEQATDVFATYEIDA